MTRSARYWLRSAMFAALASAGGWSARAQAPPAASPLAPLAFLAGHCWKGTFPDGKKEDEHCFEWFYDGRFLRDRHVVTGDAEPYGGESIYYWDASVRQVQYIYFTSKGGISRGSVQPDADALRFPEERYTGPRGTAEMYRSTWRSSGDEAYTVVTETLRDGVWVEAWHMRMQRRAGEEP